jgi:hypothetical protein
MGLADLIADAGGAEAAEGPDLAAAPDEGAPKGEDLGLEADEGGKPIVPVAALTKERARRREEAEARAKAETRIKELETQYGSRSKVFEELYGQFPDGEKQLREDAAFAQAVYELREDPAIRQALAVINKHYHGAMKAVQRETKPETTEPQGDPRVEELVRERTRDVARGILGDAKVREQLHGPILDYVMAQGVKPTREAIMSAMKEYVGAQGWTNEFLRGSGQKPKPSIVPNPGGLNAGVPSKKEAAQAPAKPKTLAELEARQRQSFKEKMAQRLS